MNAKEGGRREGEIIGPHGVGERNVKGDRFVVWCTEENNQVRETLGTDPTTGIYGHVEKLR